MKEFEDAKVGDDVVYVTGHISGRAYLSGKITKIMKQFMLVRVSGINHEIKLNLDGEMPGNSRSRFGDNPYIVKATPEYLHKAEVYMLQRRALGMSKAMKLTDDIDAIKNLIEALKPFYKRSE